MEILAKIVFLIAVCNLVGALVAEMTSEKSASKFLYVVKHVTGALLALVLFGDKLFF